MPRKTRVRIAIGLTAIVVKVAVSSLLPALFLLLNQPGFATSDDYDIDGVQKQMASMQRLATIVNALKVSGFCTSVVGFAFAFVTWILWFIRDETPGTSSAS